MRWCRLCERVFNGDTCSCDLFYYRFSKDEYWAMEWGYTKLDVLTKLLYDKEDLHEIDIRKAGETSYITYTGRSKKLC